MTKTEDRHLYEMKHEVEKLKARGLDLITLLDCMTCSDLKKTESLKDTSDKHDERQRCVQDSYKCDRLWL